MRYRFFWIPRRARPGFQNSKSAELCNSAVSKVDGLVKSPKKAIPVIPVKLVPVCFKRESSFFRKLQNFWIPTSVGMTTYFKSIKAGGRFKSGNGFEAADGTTLIWFHIRSSNPKSLARPLCFYTYQFSKMKSLRIVDYREKYNILVLALWDRQRLHPYRFIIVSLTKIGVREQFPFSRFQLFRPDPNLTRTF